MGSLKKAYKKASDWTKTKYEDARQGAKDSATGLYRETIGEKGIGGLTEGMIEEGGRALPGVLEGSMDAVTLGYTLESRKDARDADSAEAAEIAADIAAAQQQADDARAQQLANQSASEESRVLLGGKTKRGKTVGLSKGMGLTKGDTGVQV